MIASDKSFSSSQTATTSPVTVERVVCCEPDAESLVGAILAAMGKFPFDVSDGLAVQLGVSETLERALAAGDDAGHEVQLSVRASIGTTDVRVLIKDVSGTLEWNALDSASKPGPGGIHPLLARTFMTTVDVQQQQRQVVLYRDHHRGSAVSSLPPGYDFQI